VLLGLQNQLGWKLKGVSINRPEDNSKALKFWACLNLGSNILPAQNLPRTITLLSKMVEIQEVSSAWETPPVGTNGPVFINAAVLIFTELSAEMLKQGILRPIERKSGRVRTMDRFAPRPIDLDIVIFNGELLDLELWEQAYLAVPTAELLPDYVNPNTGETLSQIAERLNLTIKLRRLEGFL
jgi:2-amino-4-hydroxy-6-hydroxymethyldihydropteridine diphosphokinase